MSLQDVPGVARRLVDFVHGKRQEAYKFGDQARNVTQIKGVEEGVMNEIAELSGRRWAVRSIGVSAQDLE